MSLKGSQAYPALCLYFFLEADKFAVLSVVLAVLFNEFSRVFDDFQGFSGRFWWFPRFFLCFV